MSDPERHARPSSQEGEPDPDSQAPDVEDRAVYVISVAAELVGVHPQTLRIYERKGLLHPARTAGNTRRYSDRDIDRLRTIQRLTQELGVSLAGVKMFVEMEHRLDQMRRQVEEMDRELERARALAREEVERARRDRGGELVPIRPESYRLIVSGPRPAPERRTGPIPVGPSTEGSSRRDAGRSEG